MTTNRLVFWIAAAAAATPSLAEDSSTQVASLTMDPLVVTSTLGVETVNETLSSVTVIGSETLEQQDPTEMTDILRGQPGINVISNGSFGKNTSVYMRGTGSESTVLLLDGIRIRSATAGSAPWQYIPPQLLNRVEIVRGPKGSLYGADAVGGVVQGSRRPVMTRIGAGSRPVVAASQPSSTGLVPVARLATRTTAFRATTWTRTVPTSVVVVRTRVCATQRVRSASTTTSIMVPRWGWWVCTAVGTPSSMAVRPTSICAPWA